jgi:hypothetical protein
MTALARLRRTRQRERRATFRDSDIIWLSLFVGVPLLAAMVAYLLGVQMFRECRISVNFLVCVYRQIQPVAPVRQAVPKAFYQAFEEGS